MRHLLALILLSVVLVTGSGCVDQVKKTLGLAPAKKVVDTTTTTVVEKKPAVPERPWFEEELDKYNDIELLDRVIELSEEDLNKGLTLALEGAKRHPENKALYDYASVLVFIKDGYDKELSSAEIDTLVNIAEINYNQSQKEPKDKFDYAWAVMFKDLDKGVNLAKELHMADSNNPLFSYLYGEGLFKQKKFKESKEIFKVDNKTVIVPLWSYRMALMLEKMGENEDSFKWYIATKMSIEYMKFGNLWEQASSDQGSDFDLKVIEYESKVVKDFYKYLLEQSKKGIKRSNLSKGPIAF